MEGVTIMNPIFIEYYSHENSDCFKIKLPWPNYASHKIVLCSVLKGEQYARLKAKEILIKHLHKSLFEEIK